CWALRFTTAWRNGLRATVRPCPPWRLPLCWPRWHAGSNAHRLKLLLLNRPAPHLASAAALLRLMPGRKNASARKPAAVKIRLFGRRGLTGQAFIAMRKAPEIADDV